VSAQIKALLDKRALRPARLAEIISQADSFVDIWYQTLMADSGRRPYTATLDQAGIAIGQMVGMYWKFQYAKARPARYYPALLPCIQTPSHPSFVSNHSLQCHLIMHLALEGMSPEIGKAMSPVLRALADRIAQNREIAGVHFSEDTDAGSMLAERLNKELLPQLGKESVFRAVTDGARSEWANLIPGGLPDEPYQSAPIADQFATAVVNQLSRNQTIDQIAAAVANQARRPVRAVRSTPSKSKAVGAKSTVRTQNRSQRPRPAPQ
jgi:hypothetical protein